MRLDRVRLLMSWRSGMRRGVAAWAQRRSSSSGSSMSSQTTPSGSGSPGFHTFGPASAPRWCRVNKMYCSRFERGLQGYLRPFEQFRYRAVFLGLGRDPLEIGLVGAGHDRLDGEIDGGDLEALADLFQRYLGPGFDPV